MELKQSGKIIKGVGGLYYVRLGQADADKLRFEGIRLDGDTIPCKARGAFRHDKTTLLVGDEVTLRIDTELMRTADTDSRGGKRGDEARSGVMIEEIAKRRNELIRPPMANIDIIFAVLAVSKPEPSLSTVDKLITVAEYKGIEPVVIITKADLSESDAHRYADIYKKCGFKVFVEGQGIGDTELVTFIRDNSGKVSAFAGASGVGKSTLMNRLFPSLGLVTGEVSRKTERGRHTTRHIELYPLDKQFGANADGYIADTPGFGMLDFVQFDFYSKEDLPFVFREFEPYIGSCRYTKCTHTKEEGCAVLEAVENGEIPKERHASFLEFYENLKNKHDWQKK